MRELAPRGRVEERRGDIRLAALLDSFEELLAARSVTEIGVGEIAAAAGISRSTFYFYFASKTEALAALLERISDEMVAGADFLRASDEPHEEIVRRSIVAVVESWRRHQTVLMAVVEAAPSAPELRSLWATFMEGFVPATAARIEAERAAGRAPAGASAQDLARALAWANERNLYVAARAGLGPARAARLVDALTAIWVGAVYGRPHG